MTAEEIIALINAEIERYEKQEIENDMKGHQEENNAVKSNHFKMAQTAFHNKQVLKKLLSKIEEQQK